ncbi:PQQ-dependent sugar dehydrogenase [Nocardia salmonicida]|uniref:PQQ-dependent sugar dehydrogenase n=1 Tax=Nocardia salmonicida TaxID=53431 RepID=UPI0007A37479|nr:PQQ-dependent sugar dehydrogenase [Nocardia salmonicida]
MEFRKTAFLVAPAFALALLCACSPGESSDRSSTPSHSSAHDSPVTDELDAPWSIAFHGAAALVSERDSGRILEIGTGGTQHEVGTVDDVEPSGEGGLLGIAVRGAQLFAYYTAADDNRIERFDLTGEPGNLTLGGGRTILTGLPAAANHNGGRIAFGPDGMLYATVGDAGNRPAAQDRAALAGKILRMTPDGQAPVDNPAPGSLVYSYGHRNPQGITWAADGRMFASEFGQNTWDELNLIEPGGNYGWPEVEGIAGRAGFIDPLQQWKPSEASPSGMTNVGGSLYIANLRGERLRRIPLDNLTQSTESLVGEYGRLRDIAVAPDGSLWVLTNNTDGRGEPAAGDDRIVRLEPTAFTAPDATPTR